LRKKQLRMDGLAPKSRIEGGRARGREKREGEEGGRREEGRREGRRREREERKEEGKEEEEKETLRRMFVVFFTLTDPASKRAKPACMKKTRTPMLRRKKLSRSFCCWRECSLCACNCCVLFNPSKHSLLS